MRRDRIIYCAVAAALGLPVVAHAGLDPRYAPQVMPDNNLATGGDAYGINAPSGGKVTSVGTSATWVSPFFTVNNQTTVAGSWNNALNWSPQVVPNGGGIATMGNIGDIVGDLTYLDINPTLSSLVLSAPNNVRLFSMPSSLGGTTATVNIGAGTFDLNAPVETLRMSPSQRRFFGSTGRELLDLSFAGAGTVVKTGVGSLELMRASTNSSVASNFPDL